MNEFIVWDKFNEVFYKRENFKSLKLFFSMIFSCIDGDNGLTYHDYIGKTDIEGNKIYADSSIVRFVMSGSKKNFTATGYFFFHVYKLSYEFRCLMLDNKKLGYERRDINWRHMLSNSLKVIGTLQENPELLKEDN